MPAVTLNGKLVAQLMRHDISAAVKRTSLIVGRTPRLAVVQVAGDKPSEVYVRSKKRSAEGCGLRCDVHMLPADSTTAHVIERVAALNADDDVNGIITQFPLPQTVDRFQVISSIALHKDVDGIHPGSVGMSVALPHALFVPCTAHGVRVLLDQYGISTHGKHAVVVGRGAVAGRPIALALAHGDATITVCHKQTRDLATITRHADILVSATGCRGLITPDMVRPGVVAIDVGITFGCDGRITGDINPSVRAVASAITPVPGGVGPLTCAGLLYNTFHAFVHHNGLTEAQHGLARFCSMRPGGSFKQLLQR